MPQYRLPQLQRITCTLLLVVLALLMPAGVHANSPIHPSASSIVDVRPTGDEEVVPQPIDTLADVREAVVRIEAVGTFKDPAEGMMTSAGSGTGFIIDPEGHVVTNNHVVTGAAYFQVYVEGMRDPVNAKLVATSECADLAVIDLNGDGYRYLTWYEEPLRVGLRVFAAGFPLNDPEFTLTNGIISKEHAAGESNWASVDGVIQHDAVIDHGNSGGPLVTEDGQVVGVNYAGIMDANQFFSIGRDGALGIIEQLLQGSDVDSIGINGEAFVSDTGDFSGIWIASVASGSYADEVGIRPGDILVNMEGLPLAEDGTMATYCEILRSHNPDDTMAVKVLRLETNEVLDGQLNGRPLQVAFTLSDEASSTGVVEQAEATPEPSDTQFTLLSHSSKILNAEFPADWKEVDETEWAVEEKPVGIMMTVSPDLGAFYDDWGIPGVAMRYSTELAGEYTPQELLDTFDLSETCTDDGQEDWVEGYYKGRIHFWSACSDSMSQAAFVVLTPAETENYLLVLELYWTDDSDYAAIEHFINSFYVSEQKTKVRTTTDSDLLDLVDTQGLAYEYVAIEEPAIAALIPADYSDIESAVWENDSGNVLGYLLRAAPSIERFNTTWTAPGLIVKSAVGMSEALDPAELLRDESLEENCTFDQRYEVTHAIKGMTYNVVYDVYNECGGADNSYVVAMAESDPIGQFLFIDFLATAEADVEAFDVLLQSFYVDSELAGSAVDIGEEAQTASGYVVLVDQSGTIRVRVPTAWTDIESADWDLGDDPIGVSLTAAPDLAGFNDSWEVPGVFVGVSADLATRLTPEDVLAAFDFSDSCTYVDRNPITTDNLTGFYDLYMDCGGVKETGFVVMAGVPPDTSSPIVLALLGIPTEEDRSAFGEIVDSIAASAPAEPEVADDQGELLDTPLAVVAVERLNVRSGPGTDYGRLGQVTRGDALTIQGQVNNCAWLSVTTPDGLDGWVSGSDRYVSIDARCAEIPEAEPPAPPSGASEGATAGAGATTGGGSTTASGGQANRGCYLFQNKIGPELTITFTSRDTGKGTTFRIAPNGESEQCFDPGKYTYTLDAPPPWGSTNGELTVEAGDMFLFPISPE